MNFINFLANFKENNYIILLLIFAINTIFIVFLLILIFNKNRRNIGISKEVSELNERNDIFKKLFQKMPVGIAVIKNFSEVLYVNEKHIEVTGKKIEDFTGKTWLELTHPNDLEKDLKLFNKFKNGENDGYTLEKRYMNFDGSYIWVKLTIHPIDMKGEDKIYISILEDINERKKKEQEIEYLNNHDYLTGLYNRRYLEKVKGEYNKKEYHPISIIVCDINGLKLINDAFGEKKGDEFITTAAESLKKHKTDVGVLARTGGDDFTFIIPNTDKEENGKIVEKIRKEFTDKNINISRKKYSINISIGYCTKVNEKSSIEDAVIEAEDFMRKRKILEGKSSQNAILSSIKATMYEKSQETEEHAERLVYYARKIGKKMDLSQDTIDDLVLSANLHDLGKVGIDNQILIKEEKLSDEEWEEIKKHPEIGYRIAISSPDIAHIAEYILCHHEKWDGTGYPQGLKKEEIPLISRILSIVDAYDAMTSVRPYNIVKSKGEALQEIKLFSGKQFDPKLADIFTEILEREIEDED